MNVTYVLTANNMMTKAPDFKAGDVITRGRERYVLSEPIGWGWRGYVQRRSLFTGRWPAAWGGWVDIHPQQMIADGWEYTSRTPASPEKGG